MKNVFAAAGFTALAAFGVAPIVHASRTHATAQVMVHCPANDTAAFVTPQRVTIAVGDNIVWRTNGRIVADSIGISLKDGRQAWPFGGGPPAGGGSVSSGAASTRGEFGYNVRVVCRTPGGMRAVTIDPDIIIE